MVFIGIIVNDDFNRSKRKSGAKIMLQIITRIKNLIIISNVIIFKKP